MRIGIKTQGRRQDGSTYERAASVDYFVCPDAEFARLAGEKPKTLQITFPYATVDECFPSGLEKWAKSKAGNPLLLCYTKGDGTAHGFGGRTEGNKVTLDPSKPRNAHRCPAHDCNFYGKAPAQGCRPQARLNFLLPGGPRDGVYRRETKGLDTIQGITGVLSQYADLRGMVFELSTRVEKKGQKQYPVITIREVSGVPGGDAPDATPSPQTPASATAAVVAEGSAEDGERDVRRHLASVLRQLGQWPPTEATTAWIRDVGYEAALEVKIAELPE